MTSERLNRDNHDCDACGKPLEGLSPRARYCSHACRQAAYRDRHGYEKTGYVFRPRKYKAHVFNSSIDASHRAIDHLATLGSGARGLDAATAYLDSSSDEWATMSRNDLTLRLARLEESSALIDAALEKLRRWRQEWDRETLLKQPSHYAKKQIVTDMEEGAANE